MKAIVVRRFGGPDVLLVEAVAQPEVAAGQVRVRVQSAGVNPVDTYIRAGTYGRLPQLPYTPGTDAAGTIDAVGAGVTQVAPGDRVYTSGTLTGAYAELMLCTQDQINRLPQNVTFQQGAGVFVPYATAYRALFRRAKARPGESVLVHGASGGVGIATVQLARAAGLHVIGTAGTEPGSALVMREGAHEVLDHGAADYLSKIAALTNGRGVDVVIEMLANVNLELDLEILAQGGRIVVVGNRGRVDIDPRKAMTKEAGILGMSLLNADAVEIASINSAILAGLENGTLRPVVGKEFPLAQAAAAHEAIMAGGAHGKIVLVP